MTFCIKCGKELPESAQFCSMCGKKIQINMNKRNELPITDIIGSSFKPSMNVANFLIVFLPMVLFFMTILYVAPKIFFLIVQNISAIEASTVGFAEFIISLLGMISILIVALSLYFLFSIYQAGVVIHNIGNRISGESKPYAKSLRIGFSRYPSIFVAAILLSVLSILIGSIRYIGWLLNLIISCAFLLVYQTVVIDLKGFADGFKRSIEYLRNYPTSYIIVYIIMIIIGGVIAIIGLIPIVIAVIALIPKLLGALPGGHPTEILLEVAKIFSNPVLYVASILTCIIWTINILYTGYGIPTKLYLEIRKQINS
ncbi:zinc ribbon domain-containing protein [[Eubacterium] cellulosolvens]